MRLIPQMLMDRVEEGSLELSVVLLVRGTVVMGTLVSAMEYDQALAHNLSALYSGDIEPADVVRGHADEHHELCLRDVRVRTGQQVVVVQYLLIDADSVDALSFGTERRD